MSQNTKRLDLQSLVNEIPNASEKRLHRLLEKFDHAVRHNARISTVYQQQVLGLVDNIVDLIMSDRNMSISTQNILSYMRQTRKRITTIEQNKLSIITEESTSSDDSDDTLTDLD